MCLTGVPSHIVQCGNDRYACFFKYENYYLFYLHCLEESCERYVQYTNKRYRRTGTLWEGRHKASLIDASEDYQLACYRYVELNLAQAGVVTNPADHRWSSYRCNAEDELSIIVTAHDLFLAISPITQEIGIGSFKLDLEVGK